MTSARSESRSNAQGFRKNGALSVWPQIMFELKIAERFLFPSNKKHGFREHGFAFAINYCVSYCKVQIRKHILCGPEECITVVLLYNVKLNPKITLTVSG